VGALPGRLSSEAVEARKVTQMGDRRWVGVGMTAVTVFVLVACSSGSGVSSGSGGGAASPTGDPSTDKLSQILARGTLILSTDPHYPPQSFAVKDASRAADTKCAANALTAPEVDGYDAETGRLVAEALGVEPCFVTPTWLEITGGNWGDRWDISWGSGGINADRMTRLYMTQPYYEAPQSFFVRDDSSFQRPEDLNGQKIGVCAGCSHELYLQGALEVPGVEIVQKVQDPKIVAFDVEGPGLQAVADGKIAAFLLSEPVGMEAINQGLPLREIEEPAFPLDLTGFVDQSSGLDERAFVARVNEIILGLIADGSLPAASQEYFGTDYATAAGAFDIDSIGQEVTAP
jgi:polar amino acid transport system substrate-binding protein